MKNINYDNIKIEDLKKISENIVSFILESDKNTRAEKESFVVYLEGKMGAGKTTLAQNIGKSLGVIEHMQSPTFTLMREYELSKTSYNKLLHIDAYRFENKKEGEVLNLKEHIKTNIALIEWPNNMNAPKPDMIIKIEKVTEDIRNIKIEMMKII
jgi:tRNA threonylcarbamoyladenosine biosynthesis protein TsaE